MAFILTFTQKQISFEDQSGKLLVIVIEGKQFQLMGSFPFS